MRMASEFVPIAPTVDAMTATLKLIDGYLGKARFDVQRIARLAQPEAPG